MVYTCIYPGISHGLLHVECRVVSLTYHLQEPTWFYNAQPHQQNLLSLENLSDKHWTILSFISGVRCTCIQDLLGLDKMPKNAPRCLLFVLISLPLNDPRRQGIVISSSSQMGCLQDNSLFLWRIRTSTRGLLSSISNSDVISHALSNKASRKWTLFLSSVNLRITILASVSAARRLLSRVCNYIVIC
jgi:hypothetical protein